MKQLTAVRAPSIPRAALGAAFAVLVLLAAACVGDVSTTTEEGGPGGIAVSGVGSVSVEPDVVVVDIGVEATADTVAEARDEAAGAMNAMRDSLAANGVEDRDIRTRSFNIYPRFDYGGDEPELTGFNVSNAVEVRIRAVDKASAVIDDAIAAAGDAVRVGGIRWEVEDPAPHLDAARELAVADAERKARQLAALAGVELGAVQSIAESGGGGGPAPYAAAFDAVETRLSTSISPGEGEIAVAVTVVYAIAAAE